MNPTETQYLDLAAELAKELTAAERAAVEPTYHDPDQLREELDLALRHAGRPLPEVIANLRRILAATPKSADRRFLNQLYGGRDDVSTLAEMLAAVANTQMHTFKVAGPQVLVEQEVVRRMAEKAGYVGGEGVFTAGGSLANLMAMVLARNEAVPEAREEGLSGARLAVYASIDSHYSIPRNMGLIGLGRRRLRRVPVDGGGRMDVAALRRMIAEDHKCGIRPVMVIATAGTTVLGAFDPLREIAAVAAEHRLWLHVDGALGATVLLSPEHRGLLDGVERSDSLAWNAHKMMGVPLLCSVLLVRRRGQLHEQFHESAHYLFHSADDDLDPGTRSIQCGRRNDALKLWAAWQYHGDEGYARRVDRQLGLARHAAARIAADPQLELSKPPASINVCFEVGNRSSVEICDRLNRRGAAMVDHAVVDGRRVIRLVCVNPDLTEADLDSFLGQVKAVAAELAEGDNGIHGEPPAGPGEPLAELAAP